MSTHNPSTLPARSFEYFWYTQSFLRGFILLYPLYAIWMLADGLSPAELSLLFIVWSGTSLLFELPSGILADRFSRPRLMTLAFAAKAAGYAIWWHFPDFNGYAAGFLFWALSGALLTGACESLLFDTLRSQGRESDFEGVYGRSESINLVGTLAALAAGGALAEHGRDPVYLLSVSVPLLAIPVCLFALKEPRIRSSEKVEGTAFWSTLRDGVRVSLASKLTLLIIATFALLNLVPEALDEYEAPLLDQLPDISPTLIGMLLAGFTLANIGGNLLAERLSAGGLHGVLLAYGLIGLLLLPLMAVPVWAVISIIAVMCCLHGIGTVLIQGALQRGIHDDARSTVTSLANFAQSALALPFYGAFGGYATGNGFAAAFTMTGVFTVVVALSLSLFAGRTTQQNLTVQSEGPDP